VCPGSKLHLLIVRPLFHAQAGRKSGTRILPGTVTQPFLSMSSNQNKTKGDKKPFGIPKPVRIDEGHNSQQDLDLHAIR
jgi:hypothetical protein